MFVSVRKDPPALRLSDSVSAALGEMFEDLFIMPLLPAYKRRITCRPIIVALDVLMDREQLLPEEYADFMTYKDDNNTTIRLLEKLCSDITISAPSRRFISLVVPPITCMFLPYYYRG